jgi:hypothetical protein
LRAGIAVPVGGRQLEEGLGAGTRLLGDDFFQLGAKFAALCLNQIDPAKELIAQLIQLVCKLDAQLGANLIGSRRDDRLDLAEKPVAIFSERLAERPRARGRARP